MVLKTPASRRAGRIVRRVAGYGPCKHALAWTADLFSNDLVDLVPQALATAEPRSVLPAYAGMPPELAGQSTSTWGEASFDEPTRSLLGWLQRGPGVTVDA